MAMVSEEAEGGGARGADYKLEGVSLGRLKIVGPRMVVRVSGIAAPAEGAGTEVALIS